MAQSKQSVATRKYEKKAGWVSKTYKLKAADVEAFKETCDRLGISQAGQLSKIIREFIEQNKEYQ